MSDAEHLLMCVLAICMSSLEKYLLRSFHPFDWVVCFPGNELHELFVYWKLILCQLFICYYFLPFQGFSFHLVYSFFAIHKLLSLIRSHLFMFIFISITLGGGL